VEARSVNIVLHIFNGKSVDATIISLFSTESTAAAAGGDVAMVSDC